MAQISDLQKGLVGHWTMNSEDVDSGKVCDRSAYDNHSTLNGNYGIGLQAPNGNSVFLNGEGGTYITVPSSSKYNSKTFSISVWVNVESIHSGDSRIIYHSGSDSAITTGFGIEYRGCGGSFGGGPSSTADKWDHLTYIWDDGNDEYRTYLNGQLTNQSGMGGGCFANSNGGFNLGTPHWTSDGSYLRAKISDVRAYDRVLSEPEIQQLANQRKSPVMSVGGIDTSNVTASGGNEYTKTVLDVDYKIHEFTSDGTFSVSEGGNVDVLVVGGGGGGGGRHGAGGGAGGVVYRSDYQVNSGSSISVTIGSGGSGGPGSGTNGGNKGSDSSFGELTALGGGGGDSYDGAANIDGGSGGGQASGSGSSSSGTGLQPSSGSGGFGNDGGNTGGGNNYNHGGGGGASQTGINGVGTNGGSPGAGGDGLYFGDVFSDDFGENGYFAGGGGGGSHDPRPDNFNNEGGKGGGGHGGEEPYDTNTDSGGTGDDGESGMANTGGGGGAGSTNNGSGGGGGNGGSGIVLIRYKN